MITTRTTLVDYWATLSGPQRTAYARDAKLTPDYIGQIIGRRRRASRHAAIMLVAASKHRVRPNSIRPDLWPYEARIDQHHREGLTPDDFALEARISEAIEQCEAAASYPQDRQLELAAELAHLVRQREDHVVALLESRRRHIHLTSEHENG